MKEISELEKEVEDLREDLNKLKNLLLEHKHKKDGVAFVKLDLDELWWL